MLRLATLAAKVKLPVAKVQSDILIRSSGRLFMKWNDDYYAFKATKDVIVPYDIANDYVRLKTDSLLPPPIDVGDSRVVQLSNDGDKKKRLVLTLLGHFNHGKTSLLDTLINKSHSVAESFSVKPELISSTDNNLQQRKRMVVGNPFEASNLVNQEKYGITQEVRSRRIPISSEYELTLIDTPGQEIFYRMRNTGSEVSDGSLLLIALDEAVQQQTKESIGLVESSEKPVIVCLNKVDKVLPKEALVNVSLSECLKNPHIKQVIEECRDYVTLETAPIIPISATALINIDVLLLEIRKLFDQKFAGQPSVHTDADLAGPNTSRKPARRLPRLLSRLNKPNDEALPSTTKVLEADTYECLSGRGVVLNLLHETGIAPSLHVLLREGSIRPGDYFQSGGWFGRVKSLSMEDVSFSTSPSSVKQSAATNKSHANKKIVHSPIHKASSPSSTSSSSSSSVSASSFVDVAYPGMAVRILATYLEECVDPRPVGERIHFFSPYVLEELKAHQNVQTNHTEENAVDSRSNSLNSKALTVDKKRLDQRAKEDALRARDQCIMKEEFELFAMSETQIDRFRLMRLFASSRLPKNNFYIKSNRAAPVWAADVPENEQENHLNGDDDSDNRLDEEASGDNVVVEESKNETVKKVKSPTLVIARMKSDLDMGTFIDRYHDYRDYCTDKNLPVKIHLIQSGIGTISKSDIKVALAAGKDALVVGYCVDFESFAMKEAKENKVRVLMHDNMPDLLSEIFGSYGSVDEDGNISTGVKKSKGKRKKRKTSTPVALDSEEDQK